MKRLLCAFLLLSGIVCSNAYAQTLTIPDPNLANWMRNNGYAFAMTGNVIDSVILEQHVTNNGYIGSNTLNLSNQGISDLTGFGLILSSWVNFNSTFFSGVNLSHNQITEVPWGDINYYLGNFVSVDLSYNSIDTVIFSASLPVYLGIFDLSYNQIRHFDIQTSDGTIDIERLLLNNNLLTSLPEVNRRASPTGFPQEFGYDVSNNLLTKEPTGNYSWLWCHGNQIDSITNDCVNNPLFWQLFCDNNNITYFNLTETFDFWGGIRVDNNPLTHFDGLPPSSNALSCINCPLDTWPDFNGTGFTIFDCTNCRLTEIGIIPDHMAALLCSNNPNLACIGGLPNSASFDYDFSNTLVACVPNKVPGCVYTGFPDMASIPECASSNPNNCIVPAQISGKVFLDNNTNCVFDNEPLKAGHKISLVSNGTVIQQYVTSVYGNYYFNNVPVGTYEIVADTSQNVSITCPSNGRHTVTVGTTVNNGLNFAAECSPALDASVVSVVTLGSPRAGISTHYQIVTAGNGFGGGCLNNQSGQVTITLPPLVTYDAPAQGALPPSSVAGNTVTWVVSDFGTLNLTNAFRFLGLTNTSATFNDTVCFTALITISGNDIDLNNNQLTACFPVVQAYDPNNKLVDPAGDIEPVQEWLTYTVNFQNTGNAPALDVYVLDTLPAELDPYSIEVIAASHDHTVQVYQNGIVKFDFPDINLIDSIANEPESHGYVRFKIKIKPNLPVGTTISNRVGIYFDFNAPVMTDFAENTIVIPLPAISVYPSLLCALGDTSMIVASEFSPNYTYEWLRNGSTFNATNDTLIVTDTASYTLKVSYGGSFSITTEFRVALHRAIAVSLTPASNSVCDRSISLALTVSPLGGVLSGIGVIGNNFSPIIVGPGSYLLTYGFTYIDGCTDEATTTILVNALPTVSLTSAANTVCEDGAAIALTASPAGGSYNGATVSSNSFDPAGNTVGLNTITYNYTDGNGCSNTASADITVNASPVVSLAATSNTVCEDGAAITLSSSPAGGTYSGATLSGNNFDPADNATGLNTITYSYTDGNGCSGAASTDITVNASPEVEFNQPFTPFCKGAQPVDLTPNARPAGGTFSGTGIVGSTLDVTNTGTFAVQYTYTDGNGCSKTEQTNLVVDECIGIANIDVLDIVVYPNPVSTQVMVRANSGLEGQVILLLDISGKTVLSVQASSNETVIPTIDLANGWYMLVVQHTQGAVLYRTKVGVAR